MRPWLGQEEGEAAAEAIRSGWVAQGPRVSAFEEAVANYVGADRGVACSSCTTALHLALLVLGVGSGAEVVVPSLSFIATANACRHAGATPVFADVDHATQNLTAESIEAVLTPATRAVIVVHQVGMPANLDAVHELCDSRGIHVVEDAACALGSTYRGSPIGQHSDLVAFSFHARKVITTGEGGMITTSRQDLADRLVRLRQHGMSVSAYDRHITVAPLHEEYLETGFNYRMTDVQAAMGLVQLGRLAELVEKRRRQATAYQELLRSVPGLTMPQDPPWGTTNFQSYSVVVDRPYPLSRDELMTRLSGRGISTRRGVMAAHREPAFSGHPHAPLPVTEHLADHTILLPIFHGMTDSEQDRVGSAIGGFVA